MHAPWLYSVSNYLSQNIYLNPFFHEFYFTSIFRYNLRLPPIVYRLIGAALIRKFFRWSLLISELKYRSIVLWRWRYMKQRVNVLLLVCYAFIVWSIQYCERQTQGIVTLCVYHSYEIILKNNILKISSDIITLDV